MTERDLGRVTPSRLSAPTPLAPFDVRGHARALEARLPLDPTLDVDVEFDADETPTARVRVADAARRAGEAPTVADLARVPLLVVSRGDVVWFELSALAVHLVLRIDGEVTVAALARDTARPADEVLAALEELARQGVVEVR